MASRRSSPGTWAEDIIMESTLLMVSSQLQEVLDRTSEWKSDQDGLIREWRSLCSRLEEKFARDQPRSRDFARSASSLAEPAASSRQRQEASPCCDGVEALRDLDSEGSIEFPPGEPPQMDVTAVEHTMDLVNLRSGPVFVGKHSLSRPTSSPFRPSYCFVNESRGRRASSPSMSSIGSYMSTSAGQPSKPSSPPVWPDEWFNLPNATADSDDDDDCDLSTLGGAADEEFRGRPTGDAWVATPSKRDFGCNLGSSLRSVSKESGKASLRTVKSRRSTRSTRRHDKSVRKADECLIASKREELEVGQTRVRRIAVSRPFEAFVITFIVLNTLFIGWQTQWVAADVEHSLYTGTTYEDSTPQFFAITQVFFTVVFMFDVGLRWVADGFLGFVTNAEGAWNAFDIFTVIVGCMEYVLEWFGLESFLSSVSVVRVLRVLRLVRVVRMIRTYTFFRELRMMVESCLNGLKSYMWCCLVILLLLYVFGIAITTHTYTYISSQEPSSHDERAMALHTSFGTLDKSMLSLFQAMTGGRDWGEFYDEVSILGLKDRALFWLFLSFSVFAVMNAVAAVFVESTMQSSQTDRELLIKEQIRDAQKYQNQMVDIFEEMDADGTGTISLREFMLHLDDDRVRAYFQTLKLDVSDAATLFRLLDTDNSGTVEIEEFIEGCQVLKGEARSLDLRFLRFEMQALRRDVQHLLKMPRLAGRATLQT